MGKIKRDTPHGKCFFAAMIAGLVICGIGLTVAFGVLLPAAQKINRLKNHGYEVLGKIVDTRSNGTNSVDLFCEYIDGNGNVYKCRINSGTVKDDTKKQEWLNMKGGNIALIITDKGDVCVKTDLQRQNVVRIGLFIAFSVIPAILIIAITFAITNEVKLRDRSERQKIK